MPDIASLKNIAGAIPDAVATIKSALQSRADLQAKHDADVAQENATHDASLKKIEDDFNAAVANLPADPAAAEAEYQDFLAAINAVVSTLPPTIFPPAPVAADPSAAPASAAS